MEYTKVAADAFQKLQMNAGVLVDSFNPATGVIGNILGATTGGLSFASNPTFTDFGEDVDNCPNNLMEFKHLDGWDCSMAFTNIRFNQANIALALGAADKTGATKVTPRAELNTSDFTDLWWVGDKTDGGAVAIKLINALSTGGFSMQTTKNAKGTMAMTITGHVSKDAQDVVPMEFYVLAAPTP